MPCCEEIISAGIARERFLSQTLKVLPANQNHTVSTPKYCELQFNSMFLVNT